MSLAIATALRLKSLALALTSGISITTYKTRGNFLITYQSGLEALTSLARFVPKLYDVCTLDL